MRQSASTARMQAVKHTVRVLHLACRCCRIERATLATPFARVTFQYKLQPGACPKSYGLHVAALAGIPQPICSVAEQVGTALESRLSRDFRQAHKALAAAVRESRPRGAASPQVQSATDASEDSDVDVSDVALLAPLLWRVAASGVVGRGTHAGGVRDLWEQTKRLLPALGAL